MAAENEKPRYVSCLLRLWQTVDDGKTRWRASLEYPMSGERRGFAPVAELCTYLLRETAVDDGENATPEAPFSAG